MEFITLTPDTYSPIVNENGDYIDKIPIIKNGIYCVCGSRHQKVYNNSTFGNHLKTKKHKEWLETMNKNKANFYVELIKANELIENQKIIIQKLENQIKTKSLTVDYLTEQVFKNNKKNENINLIDL
jgi:hypothetical protein